MLPELCTFHKWDSVSSWLGLHRVLVHLCKLSESLICKQTQLEGSSLKKLKLATYFAIPVGRINRYFSQGDIWDCRRSEYTIPIYALWHKDYFELKATEQTQAQCWRHWALSLLSPILWKMVSQIPLWRFPHPSTSPSLSIPEREWQLLVI